MAILQLFSIKTAFEPCLTHISNQTIINLDIKIECSVVINNNDNTTFI
jgi:hypothetical protein